MFLILISCCIIFSTTGLIGMKLAENFLSFLFIISGSIYTVSAILWLYVLRTYEISTAFPIVTSGLLITTTLSGFFIFKESLNQNKLIGIGLLISGIIFVASNNKSGL